LAINWLVQYGVEGVPVERIFCFDVLQGFIGRSSEQLEIVRQAEYNL
jgi:hypothetical protein